MALLLTGGCSQCASPDVESVVAQWRTTLAAGLPPGSTAKVADAFFVAHGLQPTHSPTGDGIGVRFPVAPVDARSYCNPVTSNIVIDCDFDGGGRLRTCDVQAEHTGP